MSVFENDFDIKKYIEDRLLEISSLDNRRDYRDMMLRVFYHMYEDIEEKYNMLEHKVMMEMPSIDIMPEVITTVMDKKRYQMVNDFFYPLRDTDLLEYVPDQNAMLSCLNEGKSYFIREVFIKADADKIAEIKEEKPVFNGIVVTNHGQFAGKFTLVYDDFYVNKTHELYDVACINTLPWQTLCIPYFYKMFKVEIVELPGFDPQEEIKEIKIDYGSLANSIAENPLPVWNITNIKIKTGTYPDPCIDHVNYEHVLFRQNFKKNCEYMIISNDEKTAVDNIRTIDGDLIISCPAPEPVKWNLYEFHYGQMDLDYDNPLISNGQKKTLGFRLRNCYSQHVRSITELKRILAGCIVEGPELVKTEIIENNIIDDKGHYSPNDFIENTIHFSNWQYALRLDFKAKDDNYLNKDLVCYYTAVVQEYFQDFRCYGRLV